MLLTVLQLQARLLKREIVMMIDGDENGETELDLKAECYSTEKSKWRLLPLQTV